MESRPDKNMRDQMQYPGSRSKIVDAYGLSNHLGMVSDRLRVNAYREALSRAVKPGDVVVDIGTGIGIFAVMACQRGARRVYAIEPSAAIEVARQVATDNGVADRIEFIRGFSIDLELPERADVIVADVNGVLPPYGLSIATLIDARERLLGPGGALIPSRARIWAALSGSDAEHPRDASTEHEQEYGVDTSAAVPFAVNTWRNQPTRAEQLCTTAGQWAALDYLAIDTAHVEGTAVLSVTEKCVAKGVAMWFDTELIDGVRLSAAPDKPKIVYGRGFFPLADSCELAPGDRVELRIEAHPVDDDYAWRWETTITAEDGAEKAAFKQATIGAAPISLEDLRKREAGHRTALNADGEIDRKVLRLMNGERTLAEIATQVAAEPSWGLSTDEALRRAAQISERYGR